MNLKPKDSMSLSSNFNASERLKLLNAVKPFVRPKYSVSSKLKLSLSTKHKLELNARLLYSEQNNWNSKHNVVKCSLNSIAKDGKLNNAWNGPTE